MGSLTSTKAFWVLAAVTALLAGVGSYFAYSKPDALEHSVSAYSPNPEASTSLADPQGVLPGYSVPGVKKPFVSGGVAGLVGVAVTFAVIAAFGLLARGKRGKEGGSDG